MIKNVPGQAEKSSQQVWIRSSDTTKLSPTAVVSDPRQVWGEKADQGFEMQARKSSFQVRMWISRIHLQAQTW